MNSVKRQKDMTLKAKTSPPPGGRCLKYYWEKWKNSYRKNDEISQSGKDALWWMCMVVKAKSDAINNTTA